MDKNGFTLYLQSKGLTLKTIKNRIIYVEKFFAKSKKEDLQVTKSDVLRFLEYLKNKKGAQNAYRRHYLDALKHYFAFLLQNGEIATNPCNFLKIRGQKRKTLYQIYTCEELETLLDNYWHCFVRNFNNNRYKNEEQAKISALSKERNVAILSILINQGVRTGEIEKLEIVDVNLTKATLTIRGGRHSNGRIIPLKATQIGLLMHYLQNIRPQIAEQYANDSEKLFLLLQSKNGNKKRTDTNKMNTVFNSITKDIQSIDKQFINVLQIRASVITFWLKTQGLRKAQYFAGHRYVSSTESYQQNNLDNLIDNINKMHPFL